MANGAILDESEIIGGWRDFPLKADVEKIELQGRVIDPVGMLGIPRIFLAGFAVHWVGKIHVGEEVDAHARREIMVVHKCGRLDIFSYDPMAKKWTDFSDHIHNPKSPHLINYKLEQHGIRI